MNKGNNLALGAAAIAVISVFLPWVEVSVSRSTSDLSDSLEQISIHGNSIGYGLFGLLVILIGGYLAYKEFKWTFIVGLVNFIDGYGYLQGWFGASTQDSGNYGDVTSQSSVDPKFGLYLFIMASLAFMFFSLKYFKSKKPDAVLPPEPDMNEHQQPAYSNNTIATQIYQPSKIQTMTTTPSSEKPTGPVPTEKPQAPVQPAETSSKQADVTPIIQEPIAETPPVSSQPPVTPKEPVSPKEPIRTIVSEATPVYHQAPPVNANPQQPVWQAEKKRSSTPGILLVLLAIVLVGAAVFVMTNNSSQKNKDKTEQSVNSEKARLDLIINEVNQAVNDKKYDEALLKINSVNWLYEPDLNKGYVDQYNSQRENLRNTIEQLKASEREEVRIQATEEANKASVQPVQTADSIQ